jgi:hypothetical protein
MPQPPQTSPSVVVRSTESASRIDVFIDAHPDLIALIVVAVGLVLRIHAASGTFLNPDEALHVTVADQHSFVEAYKASLSLAHPPLLILLLYFWRQMGSSEFWVRLPSVITGALFCWFFFKWLKITLSSVAAITGLMFAALLSPLVALSAEVRQYSLLLLFMAAAAYLLELTLSNSSAWGMTLSGVCVWLALLSHYSGFIFAVAFGIYGGLRLLSGRPPRGVVTAWLAGEAGVAALALFLYRTQIAVLKSSTLAQQAASDWLRKSYFHPGQDNLPAFIFGRSFAVFQFIFGQQLIGLVGGLMFVAGIVLLLRRRTNAGRARRPSLQNDQISVPAWHFVVFLVLPFVISCTLAIAGRFPYGGTRHSIFLAMFALAGVSMFLVKGTRNQPIYAIVFAAGIVVLCYIFGFHHQPYMTRHDQSRVQMSQAMNFLRQQVPASDPVFVDYQASLLLGHYLCEQKPVRTESSGFDVFDCASHHIISTTDSPRLWSFTPRAFPQYWDDLARTRRLKPGTNVWVVQAGWGASIASDLPRVRPDLNPSPVESFGRNITIFRLTVATAVSRPDAS